MKAKKDIGEAVKQQKFDELLAQETITLKDVDAKLIGPEKDEFLALLTTTLREIKGLSRDKFIKQIASCIDQSTRDRIWEYNHNRITWAISTLLLDYGRMPTMYEIAEKTGLSVPTITIHQKEYANGPKSLETVEQFKFMKSKVLAKVYTFAVRGDVRAAKLYFDVVGSLAGKNAGNAIVSMQNYFIQINEFKVNQQIIQQLTPDQLEQIERVLKQVKTKQVED